MSWIAAYLFACKKAGHQVKKLLIRDLVSFFTQRTFLQHLSKSLQMIEMVGFE
ncbi:MAG: hypothetical protein NZM38_10090 [Cytophagales bacterium]|nr:hypothetical protein [Cytophagales bacterium]MDW8385105.1 hypothetical protein [Flammeovirgaceae bacterium]